jgi:hypothetical protein
MPLGARPRIALCVALMRNGNFLLKSTKDASTYLWLQIGDIA